MLWLKPSQVLPSNDRLVWLTWVKPLVYGIGYYRILEEEWSFGHYGLDDPSREPDFWADIQEPPRYEKE